MAAKLIPINATCQFEPIEGQEDSRQLRILGYTGVPLRVPGYDLPIIVDIRGARFLKKTTPILRDHDDEQRLGFTVSQSINDGTIDAVAKMLTGAEPQQILADAKEGFPFQASIGAVPLVAPRLIRAGEKVTVNNRTFVGPVYVSDETAIKELTLCTFGADPNTLVIAAKEITDMTFEEWLDSIKINAKDHSTETIEALRGQWTEMEKIKAKEGTDPNKGNQPPPKIEGKETAPDILGQAARDFAHVDAISSLFGRYADVKAVKIGDKEITASEYRNTCLMDRTINAHEVELNLYRAQRGGPAVHVVKPVAPDLEAKAMEINVLRQFNVEKTKEINAKTGRARGLEVWYDEKTLEASDRPEFQRPSLHSIMGRMIEASGLHYHGSTRTAEFYATAVEAHHRIKASGQFSTLLLSNVFENVANKIMLNSYEIQETTWEAFCQPRPASDFRPISLYRLIGKQGYQKVGIEGELKHSTLIDTKHTAQLETWGMMMGISRHHMINDDMGAFEQIPTEMGINAALALEQEFYRLLLSGDLFDGTNTIDDPLSMNALDIARMKSIDQVDEAGRPIALTPDRILTGTGLGTLASNIYRNTTYTPLPGSSTPTALTPVMPVNPVAGMFRPYSSTWISNTAIRDQLGEAIPGQSPTKWFLFMPPERLAAIYVMFLNGERAPKLDSSETTFNIPGGLMFRSYRDFGFGIGNKRAVVMSTGDGASV